MKLKNNTIQVKDHLVSGENFKVAYYESLGYASTQIQNQTDLSTYYPKTDYASHKEKPKGLKGKAYVMVQQFMLRYKHSIIKQHLSGINLLETFLDLDNATDRDIEWQILIHLVFVGSGVLLALMDYIASKTNHKEL